MNIIENLRQYENEESPENPFYLPLIRYIIERRIPGLQRDIISLHFYLDKNASEIAKILRMSRTNIVHNIESGSKKINIIYNILDLATIADVKRYLQENYKENYEQLYRFYYRQQFFTGVRQLIDSMIEPFKEVFTLIYKNRWLYHVKGGKYSKVRYSRFVKSNSYQWVEEDLKRRFKYYSRQSNERT